jgi:AcrR family transcriptional regulator
MAEQRGRGAGLSREKVLAAALAIADAEGLDALSFRRLAGHFDVTPMALYRYVESKEALLDGLGDLVLRELELPDDSTTDWREALRAVARSFRRLLIAHPAAVTIFLRRPLFTPAGMRAADAVLGVFRRADFPLEQAVLLYQQFVRFLLALVMLETERGPELTAEEQRERERVMHLTFGTLSSQEYPNLVAAAPHVAAPYQPTHFFESGLDLLIAGLDRLERDGGDQP